MTRKSLFLAFATSIFSISISFAATEPVKKDYSTTKSETVSVEIQQQDSKKNCVIATDDINAERCPACCTNNCSDCSGCKPQ